MMLRRSGIIKLTIVLSVVLVMVYLAQMRKEIKNDQAEIEISEINVENLESYILIENTSSTSVKPCAIISNKLSKKIDKILIFSYY
jgi:hypothetical protein